MGDLLNTLEVAEQRSQFDILRDIMSTAADVVSVPASYATAADGSMPINDGVALTQLARDMMMAAACATVDPRPAYLRGCEFFVICTLARLSRPIRKRWLDQVLRRMVFRRISIRLTKNSQPLRRKPTRAVEYIESLRLGLPDRGSYVLNIVSRVPPGLKSATGQLMLPVEDPFERQVTITLATALAESQKAAVSAATSGDIESFRHAVRSGVSANLCEALTGLRKFVDTSKGLAINFSWSRTRPVSESVPNRIVFGDDAMLVIGEAGRLLLATAPQEDFELHGMVFRLERAGDAEIGNIVVLGFIDEQPRKISLELGPKDYDLAVLAHRDRLPIVCSGDLVKEGRMFSLQNPRHFAIEQDDGFGEQVP
jgi:hypothetical protein